MNNEEKILQLLEKHEDSFTQISQTLAEMKATINEIDQRSIRTQVLLETDYADKLQLLFDGHDLIKDKLDALAPKSRMEALEDDVSFMKTVIKAMSQEIAELKKAQ